MNSKEMIGKQKLVAVKDVKLKQKIVIEDENGKETWSAIEYKDEGTMFSLDGECTNLLHTYDSITRLRQKYGCNIFALLGSTGSFSFSNKESDVQHVVIDGKISFNWDNYAEGMRPFCILKSDVMVSLAEE